MPVLHVCLNLLVSTQRSLCQIIVLAVKHHLLSTSLSKYCLQKCLIASFLSCFRGCNGCRYITMVTAQIWHGLKYKFYMYMCVFCFDYINRLFKLCAEHVWNYMIVIVFMVTCAIIFLWKHCSISECTSLFLRQKPF